jgi:esterase/lipase
MAARVQAPALLVAAVHDLQVRPAGVQRLFADLGSSQKVLVDLGCSSHNALWERQHSTLFRASREWLEQTAVGGATEGVVKL